MYNQITAEDYKKTFDKALNLLQTHPDSLSLDLHELAHRAVEAQLQNPSVDLQMLVAALFSCTSTWAEVQLKIENPKEEAVEDTELAKAETLLDLGKLYLEAASFLDQEEKWLFLKVWTSEDLTDEEFASIEILGLKVRKVLHAKRSTKIYFKHGGSGKGQVIHWQNFFQKRYSATAKVNPSRNRRFSQRVCN